MVKLIIYAVTAIVLIIWFRNASKNKSKWGMNFKRVICPVCQTKQPVIRMPGSLDQAAWGGTTCPKCHTRLDKYGDVIS